MSDRLTDATLAELEDIALLRLSAADREAGIRMDGQAAIAIRDEAAKRYFANLVIELRERRTADRRDVAMLEWLLHEAEIAPASMSERDTQTRAVEFVRTLLIAARGGKP
jgi:hypothetical protein